MVEIELVIDKALTAGHMAAKVEDGIAAGTIAATEVVEKQAEQQIGKIADRAIPLSKTGRPRWKRKGANGGILGGLTKSFPKRNQGVLTIEGEAKKYAARREGLGVDWAPQKPAGGVLRKNTFARDTARNAEPQVGPVFEAAFRAELDK